MTVNRSNRESDEIEYIMKLDEFIQNVADLFDNIDSSLFSAQTKYKELPGWSSLLALSIVAMIDEEYGIQMEGRDIWNSETIEDLFQVMVSRQ